MMGFDSSMTHEIMKQGVTNIYAIVGGHWGSAPVRV